MFFILFLIFIFYFKKKRMLVQMISHKLPYQIGTLSNLRTLNIRRNMIIELPTGK